MTAKSEASIRDRILDVSIALFAEGGYAGNGVRDIARAADVSVSMVSYHFGNKLGVLQEIFAEFFREYGEVVGSALCSYEPLKEKVPRLVADTTAFMKRHQAVFRIVITELPHLRSETAEYQSRYLSMIHTLTDRWLLPDLQERGGCPDPETLHRIVGPALLSMIYSTFLFGTGVEEAFHFSRDEEFYEEYVAVISQLILSALEGLTTTR